MGRKDARSPRIALVGSSGGHLAQLLAIRQAWQEQDRFWVTFDTPDATSQLADERVYFCFHPTNRNVWNLLRNTALAAWILWRERPTVIISTGAGAALPYFWLGRLAGACTIFLEVVDRVDRPTLTGRLVAPVASHVLVQWPEQRRFYRRSTLIGPVI